MAGGGGSEFKFIWIILQKYTVNTQISSPKYPLILTKHKNIKRWELDYLDNKSECLHMLFLRFACFVEIVEHCVNFFFPPDHDEPPVQEKDCSLQIW